MAKVHLNDIGTVIIGNLGVDISTATLMEITLEKPDRVTKTTFDADFVTDGTDFLIKYVAVEDDLDQLGTWRGTAYVEMPTGKWRSDIDSFRVWPNL